MSIAPDDFARYHGWRNDSSSATNSVEDNAPIRNPIVLRRKRIANHYGLRSIGDFLRWLAYAMDPKDASQALAIPELAAHFYFDS